jgi:hypothetical protein
MFSLKNSFLSLSIHRQIQIGVLSVSLWVCFLVLILISINSYILLYLNTVDLMNVLNEKENDSLENMGLYMDSTLTLMNENTKYNIQHLRNFLENNKRNNDFLKNMVKLNATKYLIDISEKENTCNVNGYYNCSVVKDVNSEASDLIKEEKLKYKKIVQMSTPLLRKTIDTRFYRLPKTQIFNHIQIISNSLGLVFYYPYNNFNKKQGYSQIILKDSMNKIAYELAENYYNRTISLSESEVRRLNKSNNQIITKNPFTIVFTKLNNFTFPYQDAFLKTSGIVSTTNIVFKNNSLNSSYSELLNSSRIDDVVMGDWSSTMIDDYTLIATKNFKGIKFILSTVDRYKLLVTFSTCHYFLKFNEIQSNLTNYEKGNWTTPFFLNDCFKNPHALYNMKKYFNSSLFFGLSKNYIDTDYKNFKRKARFILFSDYFEPSDSNKGISFKVIRIKSPDIRTRIVMKSSFLYNTELNLILFKNSQMLKVKFLKLQSYSTFVLVFILFYIFLLWYVVISIIVFIIFQFTYKLSQPISDLTNFVKSIQSVKDKSTIMKTLKNINYPDDQDIDQFFQICKSLIEGGLKTDNMNEAKKEIQINLINSYNNICYTKTNNLVVIEDQISHKLETIFSYTCTSLDESLQSFEEESNKDELIYESINCNEIEHSDFRDLQIPVVIESGSLLDLMMKCTNYCQDLKIIKFNIQ